MIFLPLAPLMLTTLSPRPSTPPRPCSSAVTILGAGHRRSDPGVGDLFLDHRSKVRAVGCIATRQHKRRDKTASTACQLWPVTHHGIPPSFNDERGVRVAQADNLFCHRHFLLLHDASFA